MSPFRFVANSYQMLWTGLVQYQMNQEYSMKIEFGVSLHISSIYKLILGRQGGWSFVVSMKRNCFPSPGSQKTYFLRRVERLYVDSYTIDVGLLKKTGHV